MQAALSKPTQAFSAAKRTPARSSRVVVCAAQQPEQWRVQRRALAGMLAALPALLPASRALALLPDDDDEELIEKAKANRKARLAQERASEQEYKRSSGYVSRADEKSLVGVQKAVNGLAKSGSQLEAGDLAGAASTVGSVASSLRAASEALSYNDASRSSAEKLLASVASLESAAKSGSASGAKRSFVDTVAALQTWVGAVGIQSSIKGL